MCNSAYGIDESNEGDTELYLVRPASIEFNEKETPGELDLGTKSSRVLIFYEVERIRMAHM